MAGLIRRVDGIDVYMFNDANWPGLADLNISIGIAKAWLEGDAQDTKFRTFWPAMRNAGLLRGAYLLIAPELDKTRAQIETLVQHFTDRIDAVGGLEPGDLPLMLDYEGTLPANGTLAQRRNRALDQLAWACHKITPYLQRGMRDPDALPMIYTGRGPWMDNDVLNNPAFADMQAYTTHDANAADRITVDFTRMPLWWSFIHRDPNILDLNKPADLAVIPYPRSWPGPRKIFFQFSGVMPFPAEQAGQATHDVNVIAEVDAANALTISTDFSPLLKLAGVAPSTADIELTRVTDLSDQPPDQVFSLLLIGQGFWPDEFDAVVQQGLFGRFNIPGTPFQPGVHNVHARQGVADIAPLNLLAAAGGRNALACYYDAGTHVGGTGLSLPLRQETVRGTGKDPITGNPSGNPNGPIDSLRIGHPPLEGPQVLPAGRTLAEYLSHLTVKLADGSTHRATEYWPIGERRTGARGSLIAVLRRAPFQSYNDPAKPADDPRPAELYQIDPTSDDQVPFVAVNVVPFGDWPLVLARAIAQNLAGVADEYELEGADFAQPADSVARPVAPNILTIDDAQRQALVSGTAPMVAVPAAQGVWSIPNATPVDFIAHTAATANPIPAWNGITQSYGLGDFHFVEGGGGYRTHVLRCDRDCLMRRIPAAVSSTVETPPALPPALPIQSTMQAFCRVCQNRILSVILARTQFALEPRVELDTQRRLFDSLSWTAPTTLDRVTVDLASNAPGGPRWACRAEFADPTGFRFTNINLVNVDYWAPAAAPHIAHVLKSVGFTGLQVEFADNKKSPILALPDALRSITFKPVFDASAKGDATQRYQVGARLALAWLVTHSPGHTCVVDAELSLVLGAMNNDIDPGGIMMGCRLYPQIAMRVRNATKGTPAVKALRGTITMVATNADASNFAGSLQPIASGKLVASLFCESNRASVGGGAGAAAASDQRKRAALRSMKIANPSRLMPPPHWSWNYDYCNPAIAAPVTIVGAWSRKDGAQGTTARDANKVWPPASATSETIHKIARQGAYDSLCIHPDRGKDAGLPVVLAPLCADLGLYLHWRHGVSPAAGPAPLHLFRGWGEGRLGQGARTVLSAPLVPPNQHVDVTVTPAAGAATVTVDYAVTAMEIVANRWQVFLEQGLAFAFQYAVEQAVPAQVNALPMQNLAWLAEASRAVPEGDMSDVMVRLRDAVPTPGALDAAVRDVWLSILKRGRRFDATADGSTEQQVPNGPSDAATLENL